MSNIFSHSLSFAKEDITKNFVTPAFLGEDVTALVTVLTDVKGTQKLNMLSRPTNITKGSSVGFSANGSIALTQKNLIVVPMEAEIEQNGEAFTNSIYQEARAKGYSYDDVAKSDGMDIWAELMLPIIADAIKQDKNRQMWFGDTVHETLSGTTPNSNPTGTVDTNFKEYNGFWQRIIADVIAGTIPAAQKISMSNAAVAKLSTQTLSSITSGTMSLTINGTAYAQAYDTSADNTVDLWVASHAATINARAGLNGVTVAKGGTAALNFASTHAGQGHTVAKTAGSSGTWTESAVTNAAKAAALTTDEADAAFEDMIDAMPSEMRQYKSDVVIMCTGTMYRNYVQSLKSTGTSEADKVLVEGIGMTHTYEGIPLIPMWQWDDVITDNFNSIYPHRALMTVKQNLVFGTDGAQDDKAIESWWNPDLQMYRQRVKYRAGTQYIHPELIVVAY